MSRKDKDILKNLKVPWITKDGYIDLKKLPIDSTLRQSLGKDDRDFCSACRLLASMYASGREEAAVYLYGLLTIYRNDIYRKEVIVDSLCHVKTGECAESLFAELEKTESSNTNRKYINAVLKSLSFFPLEQIESGFEKLLTDKKWSYRMKTKFREILEDKLNRYY